MEYSFPRYLLAKQSVDDRALNRAVLEALKACLPPGPLRIIEVGGGIGTMAVRLLRWGIVAQADYLLVDQMAENLDYAGAWIPAWAAGAGLRAESTGPRSLRLFDELRDIHLHLEQADVFDFIDSGPAPADLLIAHAFLDLLPLPEALPALFSLVKPGAPAWLTINFDGVTSLEPVIDPGLDERIEQVYHQSMNRRATGGDSRTGRHLFTHLRGMGAELLAAGASDWTVWPAAGRYPQDEAYFLHFVLHFFEEALTGSPELPPEKFAVWLAERRAQVDQAELVYIAHQMDFLAKVTATK